MLQVKNWLEKLVENWRPFLEEKMIVKKHKADLLERVEEAHQEWLRAQNYFNSVSEPELVDYAAYLLKAAESKYIYLIQQLKKKR